MRSDVVALYVDPLGPYPKLVEHWYDEKRDARTYAGPWPVVAHPPCGPWGRLRHMYKGNEHDLGPLAVKQVQKWGGILEHPAGSKLWDRCNLPPPSWIGDMYRGWTIEIEQVAWGHVARKKTWLYFVSIGPLERIARSILTGGTPTHHISRDAERARRNGYTLKRTSSAQNRRTPPAFAEWLLQLAAGARQS